MEPMTTADLPFAEQVADLEYQDAAACILSAFGKPVHTLGALDDAARHRFALAIIIGRTQDEETLRRIAAECDDGNWENNDILCAIARHPAVPVDVIVRLAWNKYLIVSDRAAVDPRIPVAELTRLACEGPLGARMGVAVNPATPAHVRAALTAAEAEDGSWVQGRVAAWLSGEWQRHNPRQ